MAVASPKEAVSGRLAISRSALSIRVASSSPVLSFRLRYLSQSIMQHLPIQASQGDLRSVDLFASECKVVRKENPMATQLPHPVFITVINQDYMTEVKAFPNRQGAVLGVVSDLGVKFDLSKGVDEDVLHRVEEAYENGRYKGASHYQVISTRENALQLDSQTVSAEELMSSKPSFPFPNNPADPVYVIACNWEYQEWLIVRPTAKAAGIAVASAFDLGQEDLQDEALSDLVRDAYESSSWKGLDAYLLDTRTGQIQEIGLEQILDQVLPEDLPSLKTPELS